MSRSVAEWVGKTDDAAIPARVRLRVWERCEGKCALTGRKIMAGEPWDLDHRIPLAMGGPHSEANLQVVSKAAHKLKTKADVADLAKARRVRLKHIGAWPASKNKLRGRGFPKGRNSENTSRNNIERTGK